MRKFLGFLFFLTFLFLLGSFFMPTQLQLKRQITVANNSAVVYEKLQDLAMFQGFLEQSRGKKVVRKAEAIYWEEDGRSYSHKIEERKGDKIRTITQELSSKQNFIAYFFVTEKGERQTQLILEINSPATLNPFLRYNYGIDKKKIICIIDNALAYIKNVSEQVHYERFYLSNPVISFRDDTVFSLPRQTKIAALAQAKELQVDSLLKERLLRYRMLDTSRSAYLQYTDWQDSLVRYELCIPLRKLPTKKQVIWLQGGNVSFVKGYFYTAIYKGMPQDLPLAWDSLYTKLAEADKAAVGLPLEQLIQKTDSTELRRLSIRLP